MEAKDTVMMDCEIQTILSDVLNVKKGSESTLRRELCKAQAEISFKAGMEEEIKGGTNAISYLTGLQDGEKKGMQKVVDFINSCYSFPIRPADGIQYWDTWIPREDWQAFLKENGLRS